MDFQSKLSTKNGSLFLTRFIEGIKDNDNKRISQIFGSIQMELHEMGKQLPEASIY